MHDRERARWEEAAWLDLPPAWRRQLRPGGRRVVPLGPPSGAPVLQAVGAREDGTLKPGPRLPVRFVPFLRGIVPSA